MATNECMYFYEDEVYRVTKKGNLEFGMVLQNADVDSDEEHSDEEELNEKLKNGHILVAWHPRGQEDVIHEKKVGLSDRCLMPGDIVRRLVPGQDTQRGYCRSISLKATVQVVGTKQVIYKVNSEDLVPLEEFAPDIAVCLDAWVGIISEVASEVEVQFPDGSTAVLTDQHASELVDPSCRRLTDSEFRVWFYPGQLLTGPMRLFDSANFTQLNPETKKLRDKQRNRTAKVLVSSYRVNSIKVHWQCRAVTESGSLEHPSTYIDGDDLKRVRMLNVFEPCTLQLGDMNTYVLKQSDLVMPVDEWKWLEKDSVKVSKKGKCGRASAARGRTASTGARTAPNPAVAAAADTPAAGDTEAGQQPVANGVEDDVGSVSSYGSRGSAGKRSRRVPSLKTLQAKKKKLKRSRPVRHPPAETRTFSTGERLVVETVKTESSVTVVWQDGTVEEDLPSVSLHPSHHLDEHEFFPGDFVVVQQKGADAVQCSPSYGVVQSVDHAGRTAQVDWYQSNVVASSGEPIWLRRSEESVYDLSDHPDFRYRPGTVVISVSPLSMTGWSPAGNATGSKACPGCNSSTEAPATNSGSPPKSDDVEMPAAARDGTTDESKPSAGAAERSAPAANLTNGSCDDASTAASPSGDVVERMDQEAAVAETEEAKQLKSSATGELEKVGVPAGGEGEKEKAPAEGRCHAGQVLEVLTTGAVQVWWADGTVLNCYPQDLFRVGEYDSDEGELWDHNSQSAESGEWETESEESVIAGDLSSLTSGTEAADANARANAAAGANTRANAAAGANTRTNASSAAAGGGAGRASQPRLAHIIEKLSVHLAKLESMFAVHSEAKLSRECCSKILSIYSNSRCLDRLMDTQFFDSGQFSDLVNKIRAWSTQQDDASASGGDTENHPPTDHNSGMTAECGQLCAAITRQLMLAHEEVVRRYGSAALVPPDGTNQLAAAAASLLLNLRYSQPTADATEKEEGGEPAAAAAAAAPASDDVQMIVQEVPSGDRPLPAPLYSVISSAEHATAAEDGQQQRTEPSPPAEPLASPDDGRLPADSAQQGDVQGLVILSDEAPSEHRFVNYASGSAPGAAFVRAVRRDLGILRGALPTGVAVRGWDSRLDLYSVLIVGPRDTPYEDGLFAFDVLLGEEYPTQPPTFHYHSYCQERLNPNLYEDGKVCVSLLGTWSGKGSQVWSNKSTLLQVLVSVQGLILAAEPYYNEAGYERQRGSQQGLQNSRLYNERVLLKLVQSVTNMLRRPPAVFGEEVREHARRRGRPLIARLRHWIHSGDGSVKDQCTDECRDVQAKPGYPLLPMSKGCQMTLKGALHHFEQALNECALSKGVASDETTSDEAQTSASTAAPAPNPCTEATSTDVARDGR